MSRTASMPPLKVRRRRCASIARDRHRATAALIYSLVEASFEDSFGHPRLQ